MNSYWQSTKHPWTAFCFVLPLLLAYEAALYYLQSRGLTTSRAALDHWIGQALSNAGISWFFASSLLMILAMLFWTSGHMDRPSGMPKLMLGQVFESLLFAMALWGVGNFCSHTLGQLSLAIHRAVHLTSLAGSGIYEELIFRWLLFGFLFRISKWSMNEWLALALAALSSSIAFSAAHHIGSLGENWSTQMFLLRAIYGVLFVLLYHYRGLGIAVGTHVTYNLLIGAG